jgi:hypothetical protein
MEKCYRDIQNRGQIAGLNILEIFILLGVPILLFPIFTLINLGFGVIIIIEVFLYTVFRLAARVSHFDYGLISFIYSKFIWPRKLSAYALDEKQYFKGSKNKAQESEIKLNVDSKKNKMIKSGH